MKKITIRRATPWDVIKVTRLLVQGAAEQAKEIWYPKIAENPMRYISNILALIDVGLVIVAEDKEHKRIVAALGFQISQNSWSDDWEMSNEWMYILPTYRNSSVSVNLLEYAENWADDKVNPETGEGLPMVMAVLSGKNPELKDELLKRRGYQYGGGNFVRAPTNVQEINDGNADAESTRVA